MLRQLELDRLDALARALTDAGSAIARARVAAGTAGAAGAVAALAEVEQWTARAAADIRTRSELVAETPVFRTPVFRTPVFRGLLQRVRPGLAWGATEVVVAAGAVDAAFAGGADLLWATAHETGGRLGPVAPLVDDGAAVVADGMRAVGEGVWRTGLAAGAVLDRAGRDIDELDHATAGAGRWLYRLAHG